MIKKFILIILTLLFCGSIFAAPLNLDLGSKNSLKDNVLTEADTINYLFLYTDNNDTSNKISYEINYLDGMSTIFELYLKYNSSVNDNDNFEGKICNYDLSYSDGDENFEKVTCEVSKLGNGDYEFRAYLKDESGEVIASSFNAEFIFGDISMNQEFIEIGDKTQVVLHVKNIDDKFKIASRIPKSVIKNLNLNNKNDLIYSDFEYEIIDSDPLIAWSVEEIPSNLNYTINKKVSLADREKFKIELVESDGFKFFNYIAIILVGIILFFIFRPMFKR